MDEFRKKLVLALRTKILPGTFGGFCIEVLRLYKIYVLGTIPLVPTANKYWWVSMLFIICGGGAAHIWNDKHALRSFYIGLSFPAIIAAFSR